MSESLEARIRARARRLGFAGAGIAAVHPSEHEALYDWWIERGHHGEMAYLARDDARARRYDLTGTLAGVRSAIVVAHEYGRPDPPEYSADPSRAVVATYARGDDYHDVILPRLQDLHRWLEGEVGHAVSARPYVDTGPLLERELGWRAGLGWLAKNTMLIHPARGSYFFLGVLLTDLDLEPDEPLAADHCGTCTACLDGCPTGALLGRRTDGAPVMDARRCISYLTIELRGAIPRELRPLMGNRVFGCDICQEVCPWNVKFARGTDEKAYGPRPELDGATLLELAELLLDADEEAFRERFRRSPVWRARRAGLLRNVCVALGNWGVEDAVAPLERATRELDALVRGHAAWALGRIGGTDALAALAAAREGETDPWVKEELDLARGP